MSLARILNVKVVEPQAPFLAPYKFEITFECISALEDDLEFKLIYVGSANTKTLDQELDSLLVGPVPVGINKFLFEADAPVPSKIPEQDLMGVTIILLTCSYMGKMFERIGYYVDNAYMDQAMQADPPKAPVPEKLFRNILADKPRVTRYAINWDDPTKEEQPPVLMGDDEEADDDVHVMEASDDNGGDNEGEGEDNDAGLDEEDDEDEKGEVDLDMTEEQDEAELMSGSDNDDESGEEREDEGHGGDEMAIEEEHPKDDMVSAAASDAV
ncbi:Histone chaperone asf1, partial [Coemansia biformis]